METFSNCPTVSDKTLYEVGSDANILFDAIENVVQLFEPQRKVYDNPEQVAFKRVLTSFQEGNLDKQDWNMLKTRCIQTAHDSNNPIWDDAPHIFFDYRSSFEYNMSKLQDSEDPIERLKVKHNISQAENQDSN